MKTFKPLVCAISVVAALAVTQAQAQTLSTELLGFSPTLQVMGTYTNAAVGNSVTSGVMNFQDFTNATFFNAFCVEPEVDMMINDQPVYEIQNITLLPNREKIAKLVGGYLASNETADDAAAVHWAIWEVVREDAGNPYSLSTGVVQVKTPDELIAALADQYLFNIDTFQEADLVYLKSSDYQDIVSWDIVPEPGTAGLVVLSALCFFRRKR